jgi:hypothetical protein
VFILLPATGDTARPWAATKPPSRVDHLCVETRHSRAFYATARKMFAKKATNYDLVLQRGGAAMPNSRFKIQDRGFQKSA